MFANVLTAAILGLDVCPIRVEADVSDGLPSFTMVGFPSAQVREAQDRVRTSFRNNGISLPPKRVTVNFSPADIRKEGAGYDLPVAAAVLAASGILDPGLLKKVMMIGELSLNGDVRPVSGVLPIIIKARELKCRFCIIPKGNLAEARLLKDMPVIGVENLKEMITALLSPQFEESKDIEVVDGTCEAKKTETVDFEEVYGQVATRRATEIAVSGFHNILYIGSPGAGKTMMAKRIPTIMPQMTFEEEVEVTRIYSIAGLLSPKFPLIRNRPFRNPHHTSTPKSLSGGGMIPTPGEITLAHRGVLFLDEMAEFSRECLETLRQPLEDKKIQISRAGKTYVFPADFLLVAAINPCPCGYYPDMNRCRCSVREVTQYLRKISQPLLDRIDICTEVAEVDLQQIKQKEKGETSQEIRKRVEIARQIQSDRFKKETIRFNAQLIGREIEKYCPMTKEAEKLLDLAYEKMKFSMRSYHKILKVARTIADLEQKDMIESNHISEALNYKTIDKKYWN